MRSAPPPPLPTTVACAYSITDNCWVTGDFVASVTPATGGSGSLVYQICRSNDSAGGFAGCEVNLTLNGTTSITVSGTHLPGDGNRRAYYFLARDSTGTLGPWNSPRYVRVDRYAPTISATNASDTWFPSRTATISAGDTTGGAGANSGLVAVRYSWNVALNAACTTGTGFSMRASTFGTSTGFGCTTSSNFLRFCSLRNASPIWPLEPTRTTTAASTSWCACRKTFASRWTNSTNCWAQCPPIWC